MTLMGDVAELEDPSVNSADAQKNTVDAGSADAASATATGAEIVNGVVVAKENDWVREGISINSVRRQHRRALHPRQRRLRIHLKSRQTAVILGIMQER